MLHVNIQINIHVIIFFLLPCVSWGNYVKCIFALYVRQYEIYFIHIHQKFIFFLVIIDSSPRFVIKECFYLPPKDVQCSRKMCYVEHFTKWRWLNLGQVFDTLCFWCDIALKSRTTSRLSCLVLIEGNNKTFQQFLTRIAVRRQFLVVSLQLEVVRGEI